MQKSREALADARKSIQKTMENKQWTYCSSFILKTWFYSLVPFFCFLIRNFHSFCSFLITVTDLRILTNMLMPGTTLIKHGSSFPPPRLFRAPRQLKMAHLSHHHAYFGQHTSFREGRVAVLQIFDIWTSNVKLWSRVNPRKLTGFQFKSLFLNPLFYF